MGSDDDINNDSVEDFDHLIYENPNGKNLEKTNYLIVDDSYDNYNNINKNDIFIDNNNPKIFYGSDIDNEHSYNQYEKRIKTGNENEEKDKSVGQIEIGNDITQNSFESSLYWSPMKRENKKKNDKLKYKENPTPKIKMKSVISSERQLLTNINDIEKTIFNIRNDSIKNENKFNKASMIPGEQSKVVCCEDFSSVPQEILEDIKNYNELRLEEYQQKMTERKMKQKANKRVSSLQNSPNSNSFPINPSKKMICMSPFIKNKVRKSNNEKKLDQRQDDPHKNHKNISLLSSENMCKNILKHNSKENNIDRNEIIDNNNMDKNYNNINKNKSCNNYNTTDTTFEDEDKVSSNNESNGIAHEKNDNNQFNNNIVDISYDKENIEQRNEDLLDYSVDIISFTNKKLSDNNSNIKEKNQTNDTIVLENLDNSTIDSKLSNEINRKSNITINTDTGLNEPIKPSKELVNNNKDLSAIIKSSKEVIKNNEKVFETIKSTKELINNNRESNKDIIPIKEQTDSNIQLNEDIKVTKSNEENKKKLNEDIKPVEFKDNNEELNKDIISTKECEDKNEKLEISDKKFESNHDVETSEEETDYDYTKTSENDIKLLEAYAEQDYQKEIDNFQFWLQKKNEIDQKKKLELQKNKNYLSSMLQANNCDSSHLTKVNHLMSNSETDFHDTHIIKIEGKTKERKEKNEKAYKDWLNDKISQEKEKKIKAMSKKIKQLEKEKEEIKLKDKIEERKKEKLKEWMKEKKEQEKNKKKEEEKLEKEEKLKKIKKKQKDDENFREWCHKKEQEKKKLKGKNLEEKFHIAMHTKEWIDPNAPEEEISPIVPASSQPESIQNSKNSLYKGHSLYKSKSRCKSKGLFSTLSMSGSVYGGLVINYKDSNLFTDSEKKLFTKNAKKTVKKKKSKKNNKVNGSYGDGIYGDYDTSENKKNKVVSFISKEIASTTNVNSSSSATPSNHTKLPSSNKNQNYPPSLFEDYKKYENYPDFKRKYPLLVGNAGLEMLLLEQKELLNEEKRKGVPSKAALAHQLIQITGKKDDLRYTNLPLKNNISFHLEDEGSPETISQATPRKTSVNVNGRRKSQTNFSSSTNSNSSSASLKRKSSTNSHASSVSSRKNSTIASRRKSSSHVPVQKVIPVKNIIDPSLLQFLIEHQKLDYKEMCKTIKDKLLEDHIPSIISNDDGKTRYEREEELMNASYHTTRQRKSDLFQNKEYLENLIKSLSTKSE